MPCAIRDDINSPAMARRQPRQVAQQSRAAGRPVRQPSSRLQVQLRPGAWLLSITRACHRLARYSSPITHPFREGAPVEQSQPTSAPRRTRVSKPPQPTRSPALNGPLPAKSMDKADSVFKNFTVSGFPKDSRPASYVDPAHGPAAVHSAQRRIMTQQLNRLSAMDAPDGGMTLALPESEVEKLLPSLNAK